MTVLPASLVAAPRGQRSRLGKTIAMLAGSTDGEVVRRPTPSFGC
jgi:hypothetical protein